MIDFGVLVLTFVGMVLLFFLALTYLTTRCDSPVPCDPTSCPFEDRWLDGLDEVDRLIEEYEENGVDESFISDLHGVRDVLMDSPEDDG